MSFKIGSKSTYMPKWLSNTNLRAILKGTYCI
jgi:hypothetical protein